MKTTALILTPRQLEVLDYVRAIRASTGSSPTLSEIADALDVHKSTVRDHVRALVEACALERSTGRHRGLVLTPLAESHLAARRGA